MHRNEVFCRAGCEASEIQENPRVSNMVVSRETTLTQSYELPLDAFKLFSVSGRYRAPYSCGILRFGLTGVKYNIIRLSLVEKEQVTDRVKPSVLTDWEKM
jgi:hypothetical protein